MSGPGDRFTRSEGTDWLTDYFAKAMPDAMRWFEEQAAAGPQPVTARPVVVPVGDPLNPPEPTPDGFLIPQGVTNVLAGVTKLSAYIEIPDELAMAYGLIPDTRPPLPPLPWRWRLRSKVSDWREQAARRAYKLIAGDWPDDREDDW